MLPLNSDISFLLSELLSTNFSKVVSQISQNIKIIHFPFSEHDGVIMTLKVSEPERGPGLWKMNNTVIQTDLFKHIFESFWNKWKLQKNEFKNKLEWWEQTKIKIKSLTIGVSKNKFTADENEIYTRV
jgi:hypothetical protein